MMSQRFSLFYAGFTAYAPALYFHQLEFADSCLTEENGLLHTYISEFSKNLEDKVYESSTHIKTAMSVANHLEIEQLPLPVTHAEYFSWLNHYIESMEKEFPMGRIDHYYFLYARKIAEIICNLGLIKTYVDVTVALDGQIDLSRKIEKCLKDTEFILFKLMAAAALLSSEPRQNYFNEFYRLLCNEFLPFKNVDVAHFEKPQLIKLNTSIKDYDLLVMDGFKKCIGLLKELGI
jgi:hypothetical protein